MTDYKLKLTQITLSNEDNPTRWSEEGLGERLNGEVVVGYMLRMNKDKFVMALYSIKEKYLINKDKQLSLQTLVNAFNQWLDSMKEDPSSILFRNPPIEEWLDSKDNWIKKLSHNLSKSYNKPYDECLSELYYTIMTCYNKDTIYLGSLNYITTAAHNAIKLDFRYMKNRLTGSHPLAIHLDAGPSDFGGSLEDSIESFHEIIGGEDNYIHEVLEFGETKAAVIEDLSKSFSPREIDQLLNRRGPLPTPLYRKLLKWRKNKSLEDYK